MGVPQFMQWIRRKRNFIGVLNRGLPENISSFSMDMNGLFHEVAQEVYGYGNKENRNRRVRVLEMSEQELQNEYLQLIGQKLLTVLRSVDPRNKMDALFLMVDGVAPMAKITQQRSRRFKKARESAQLSAPIPKEKKGGMRPARGGGSFNIREMPPVRFDSNAITPGTNFMRSLDEFIRTWIEEHKFDLPRKVIYSSHMVPGEGEHKIMDLIRDGELSPHGNHIIYGLDADLIILSMMAPLKKIYLMREDVGDIINIANLRRGIWSMMGGLRDSHMDFSVLMSLIGNDFLPHSPSFEDLHYGLDQMIRIYRDLGLKIVTPAKPGELSEIDSYNFLQFLNMLKTEEPKLMKRESNRNVRFPSRFVQAATNIIQQAPGSHLSKMIAGVQTRLTTKKTFNFNTFRGAWYQNIFSPKLKTLPHGIEPPTLILDDIVELSKHYLTGVNWVYRYYQLGTANINLGWFFPEFHGPLFIDLHLVFNNMIARKEKISGYMPVDGQKSLNPVHQLLSVLPIQSKSLLPPEVLSLIQITSPIGDLYPIVFEIELD